MVKSKQSLSETDIASRIKKGRGLGEGKFYQPWIKVHEVPSSGRSHRIWSQKTGRVHHLLSDLELAVFMMLEWLPDTTDIREQYPLRREDTRAIAADLGIKHPGVRGVDQVMSSDFLIDSANEQHRQFAIQVKPLDAFEDVRTIEKLELERRYWQLKLIPWYLVTNNEIDPVVRQNMQWLLPDKSNAVLSQSALEQIPFMESIFQQRPEITVIDICKHIDSSYGLELGQSLRDIRTLVANGLIKFDIFKPFQRCFAGELKFYPLDEMEALRYVGNE
ncbi:TnsA endonuclease N-terminal domain-containing protein [Serratia proteamaculans]|uniref:Heteromeric transposase endonuclease subunit TnsA n=1 Tax=Serratia proteamaculans TaxID=28151 RepID=A0A5Q2VAH2_SERPR|nr:TnsA endonuclease N-terminal domain-containing protein [Serratia proteamaculans]QGH61338.1 heteromeric transposase endonuclease subunit TnsA [Serratia proteamaculans]